MAFKFKKIPFYLFIAANLVVVGAMNFCAFSGYLPPQTYPNWSYFGLMFPFFLAVNIAFVVFWLIFKRKVMLLPLVGMALCCGSVRAFWPVNFNQEPPEGAIKLLTYNVMYFNTKDYPDAASNPIVDYIVNSGADIVCLQEAKRDGAKEEVWKRMEKVYEHVGNYSSEHNNVTVLSRYPVVAVENIEYPAASNCSVAFHLKKGDDTIVVINNHFESYKLLEKDREDYKSMITHPKDKSNDEKYLSLTEKLACANAVRGVQTDSVAAYIERHAGKYVVCCGDFNDPAVSYTHHRLTSLLNDAYTRSGNGPGFSYNRSGMLFRIDNILVSDNINAYGAVVDAYSKASDHYPLYCYLKIGKK